MIVCVLGTEQVVPEISFSVGGLGRFWACIVCAFSDREAEIKSDAPICGPLCPCNVEHIDSNAPDQSKNFMRRGCACSEPRAGRREGLKGRPQE